jgi:hypothetical protein
MFCAFWPIFGQAHRYRRIGDTPLTSRRRKYGSAVNMPVMKPLPESS